MPRTSWAVLCLCFICCASLGQGADIDFLLAMAETVGGVNVTFPEWRRDNIANNQSWPGVFWDPFDRSRIVGLPWDRINCCGMTATSGESRVWIWNGTFPLEEFLTLTHLESFYIIHTVNFIYDMYSNRTLTLPRLSVFQIDGGSTRLVLPDRWPANLTNVHFSKARLVGHGPGQLPPALDSPTQGTKLVELECTGCGLTCPLPQWLVSRIQSGQMNRCLLHTNYFEIIDGKVCGQIPADSTNCVLVPILKKPPSKDYFARNAPDLSFSTEKVVTEFYGNSVFVFLKYFDTFTNQTKIYRDEYLGWIMQPWGQSPRGDGSNVLTRFFELRRFTLVARNPAGTIVNVTANYGDVIDVEYTFFLGDPEPEVVRWDMRTTSRVNSAFGTEIVITQEYMFRLQHSGRIPLGCIKPADTFLYSNCTSDVAEAYFFFNPAANSLTMQFGNPRLSAQLSYPFNLDLDGSQVYQGQTSVLAYAEPYGNVDRVQQYKRYFGPTRALFEPYTLFTQTAPDDQYVSVFALIYVPVWNRSLEYDPEFRFNLLFDPSLAAPAAPEVVAQEQAALTAGVVAAIVIVAIAVAAVFTFAALKFVVFPYYAARKENDQKQTPLDDADEEHAALKPHSDPQWRSSKKPEIIANS